MALSSNMRGAGLMALSMTCFTVNDAMIKLLGADLPFFQILFLRSVAASVILVLLAVRMGALSLTWTQQDRWLVIIRSVGEVGAAYFFLTALIHMELANVSAILQSLPLTVSLAAAVFLGESVGWRRFAAIGIGFIGVMLIVRPGGDGFTIYSVYALAAVACVTVRDLAARRLSAGIPSMLVAAVASVAVLVFAAVGAVNVDWAPLRPVHWAWLSGSVVMILGAYLFSVSAMRHGDIGFVAPFRYTSLLVALLLGFLIFGDWPDRITLLGAAIVVATGLYTLWRERKAAREPT